MTHVLLLLRHAKAENFVPGRGDEDRPLTDEGREQARGVGEALAGVQVDRVLCSPAVRTRQTLDELGLDCPVDLNEQLYNTGSDTILSELCQLGEDVVTVLVIGHAPGVPALANDLADDDSSDPGALATLRERFPTATFAQLEFGGSWAELRSARLTHFRIG